MTIATRLMGGKTNHIEEICMSYFEVKEHLLKLDLKQARRCAQKDVEPARSFAVALKESGLEATFDSPSHPNARWGAVCRIKDEQVTLAFIGSGHSFEIQSIRHPA
jgi:hypothetical protein